MRSPFRRVSALLLLGFFASPGRAEDRIELSLPIACEPHKTCFIQNYVDNDPGTSDRDFACGGATYEGHKGVDFRLLSAEAAKAGVNVVASADGTVKALRDGMPDVYLSDDKVQEIKGRECGNGVVIDHGNGWETQYCHMLKGSIKVTKGQAVKRGDALGHVGYSGFANFAHVHLQVRHNNKVVDPFLPDAAEGACQRDSKGTGLWQPSAIAPFPYRNGEIIDSGFTPAPPTRDKLEDNHRDVEPLKADSAALIFYARFINLLAGDRIRIVIDGPGGTLVEQLSEPLEKNRHRHLDYAGKKRRELPWQQGRYEARAEIIRDGAVAAATVNQFDLVPPAAAAR
ncbi:MAG: M23 family metallopeptidase [Hyphomicrobium sp.]